jgi:phage tail sheath protein FI
MTEYLAPGVYVEEVAYRAKAIEGVSTSATGFIGAVRTGPTNLAVGLRCFADHQRTFGDVSAGSDLGCAVQQFFANGGADAWVVGMSPDGSVADALTGLDPVQDLAILCVPGEADPEVLRAALRYAERRRAFLIIDPPGPELEGVRALVDELAQTGSPNAAVYFPAAVIGNAPNDAGERPVSGAVAGVYARTDASRGVWRAPAGTDAILLGVQDVAVKLREADVSALEACGVNVIREEPSLGLILWGARTIQWADDVASEFKYVPVRRLCMFIEDSIERGIQWAVFEPNDEPLWAALRLTVGVFLDGLFRAGAFAGTTSQQSFFVRCDRSTMAQDDFDSGVVSIMIGIAPVRAAEFVVMEVRQRASRAATEQLGPVSGAPGLVVSLAHRPVSLNDIDLQVEGQQGWTMWSRVDALDGAGPDDPVYTVDGEAGLIRFGDGIRGAAPPQGARIEVTYRYGSGRARSAESA